MFINETNAKPESRKGHDIKAMEHPTLKVPYELLNKKYRFSQKAIDREVSHLNQSLIELTKSKDLSNVHRALNNVVENLQVVKRKADESILDEQDAAHVCKRRLDHLKGMFELPYNEVALNVWKKTRLDRLLVDHLLRDGYYETAAKLTRKSGLENLTNMELFMTARRVETSLEAGDTSKCLAWCHENKSKLRKLKSTLEFKLRQQEFIELIKKDRRSDAIFHCRKYLSNFEEPQRGEFEHMMALIALPLDTQIEPYRRLLDKSRWKTLVEDFKRDNYNLFQLNSVSVFSVVLQAGLSSLKTPHCYRKSDQRNPECPLCSPLLNDLARGLPYPHSSQSKLICPISGLALNENNPPMMLPNGHIYGEISLKTIANNGRVVCPKTQQDFRLDEALKVYVM
uniref:E3 ubiquitin-protein transferase MAEA n=1 Tax=Aceria tosichella TaxID=561515 RepID=A0A6G1SLS1_9ACAR